MPKIDVTRFMEQSGMRKARFGGYEPEDVHQAMEDLCADYEQHLTAMTSELRTLRQENDALPGPKPRPARPNRKTLHCSSIARP